VTRALPRIGRVQLTRTRTPARVKRAASTRKRAGARGGSPLGPGAAGGLGAAAGGATEKRSSRTGSALPDASNERKWRMCRPAATVSGPS
jgi:hypothetical protein